MDTVAICDGNVPMSYGWHSKVKTLSTSPSIHCVIPRHDEDNVLFSGRGTDQGCEHGPLSIYGCTPPDLICTIREYKVSERGDNGMSCKVWNGANSVTSDSLGALGEGPNDKYEDSRKGREHHKHVSKVTFYTTTMYGYYCGQNARPNGAVLVPSTKNTLSDTYDTPFRFVNPASTVGSRVMAAGLLLQACSPPTAAYSVTFTRKVTRPRNLSLSSLFFRLEPSILHSMVSSVLYSSLVRSSLTATSGCT